jgi:hypothetical protein
MAEVKYLIEEGRIPPGGNPNFPYLDFPGLHVVGLSLVQITGMDVFMAIRVYLVISGLLLTLLLYAGFLRRLGTPARAAMSVVLAIASSMVLGVVTNQFHPINLSTIYIATFFLLLTIPSLRALPSSYLFPLLILMFAATIEYVFTPVFFSMVLLSIYVLHPPARSKRIIAGSSIVFPLIFLFTWEVYVTVWNFPNIVRQMPEALRGFVEWKWLLPTEQVLAGNLGPSFPWWGNVTRLYWWVSVFGFGTILAAWRVISRPAAKSQDVELAFFLGILATMVPGSLVGGIIGVVHGGLSRYVWIAPIALAPILVKVLDQPRARSVAVPFTIASLALLFPTFLTNGSHLSTHRTYAHELAVGEFISDTYGKGKGLTLYCDTDLPVFYLLYATEASVRIPSGAYGTLETQMWQSVEEVVTSFRASSRERNLLIAWPKMRGNYQERMGISPDHPNWRVATEELSTTIRIYDNRNLQLYAPYY